MEMMHGARGASLRRLATTMQDRTCAPDTAYPLLDELDEAYCALMATPVGGLLDVPPQKCRDLMTFITERAGTLLELGALVVIVSPDQNSQLGAIDLLDVMLASGVSAGQCSLILIDCPRETQPEAAFNEIHEHLKERKLDEVIIPGVMHASRVFEEAQMHKLSISALINATDLDREFRAAREKGVGEKKLQILGRRLMAARAVAAAAREFGRIYDALALPRAE